MPCSRSARRPSVSSARLVVSSPRSREVRSTASSWSSKIDFESYSSRPISVDLPSSTDPAVANRNRSMRGAAAGCPSALLTESISEVPLTLAVFHRCLAGPVVAAGLAALGDPGRRDLGDHLGHRPCLGGDRAGAGHAADGAVPHRPRPHCPPPPPPATPPPLHQP